MIFKEHGLYIVSEKYFKDFPSKHWMENKSGNRPHYYSLKDPSGVFWLIPLSSQVENYKLKILKEENKRGVGNCIFYHIGEIAGTERVFIISDLFPVIPEYIIRPYRIKNVDYCVKNDRINRVVRSKSIRYIRLLEQNKLTDRNNILSIREQIIKKLEVPV